MSGPTPRPPSARAAAVQIVRRLQEQGHVAYLAGGCVRDELLGLTPKDHDVATDAPPQRVRDLFPQTQAVGAAFGVILVRMGGSVVEVATFRSDDRYEDGRRPVAVRFTTAEEDARRRDFTINGLFLDPVSGAVVDHVGGRADLERRVIRAIGSPSQRFEEDHLRLLRATRFAARLGFAIEPATMDAIVLHAPRIIGISPERIAEELRLMLCPPTRAAAWRLLWRTGLLRRLMRLLPERPDEPTEDRMLLPLLAPDEAVGFGVALAVATTCYRRCGLDGEPAVALLAPDAAGVSVRAMRRALRLSNDETDAMRQSMDLAYSLLVCDRPSIARRKRFLASAAAPDARRIIDVLGRRGIEPQRIAALQAGLREVEARGDVAPPPLLTGDDLVAEGLSPGPRFRVILDAVYDEQLEGRIADRDAAVALALRLAGQ